MSRISQLIKPILLAAGILLALITIGVFATRPNTLSNEALKNLSGRVGIDAGGELKGDLYNGTKHRIADFEIRLTIYNDASAPKIRKAVSAPCSDSTIMVPKDGKTILVREYLIDGPIKPFSVTDFSERSGISLAEGDSYGCQITGAKAVSELCSVFPSNTQKVNAQTSTEHGPWWTPAFFILLGGVIGFLGDRMKIWWDSRAVKKAFLTAIGLELEGLREQLAGVRTEVAGARGRLERSEGYPGQFAISLRNTIFETQLGKLRDLSDPLLQDVTRFYSDLSLVLGIVELLNEQGRECTTAWETPQRDGIIRRIISSSIALDVTVERLAKRIENLLPRLPALGEPTTQ